VVSAPRLIKRYTAILRGINMPVPYQLEKDVLYEIDKYFKIKDRETVIHKLASTPLWAEQSGPPARIHLAIIWKSKGNLKVFENSIEYDAGDWRDLLIETGLASENWIEFLNRKGIFSEKWVVI
jgi:hypothetical protein